jgi:hypothetical protein
MDRLRRGTDNEYMRRTDKRYMFSDVSPESRLPTGEVLYGVQRVTLPVGCLIQSSA